MPTPGFDLDGRTTRPSFRSTSWRHRTACGSSSSHCHTSRDEHHRQTGRDRRVVRRGPRPKGGLRRQRRPVASTHARRSCRLLREGFRARRGHRGRPSGVALSSTLDGARSGSCRGGRGVWASFDHHARRVRRRRSRADAAFSPTKAHGVSATSRRSSVRTHWQRFPWRGSTCAESGRKGGMPGTAESEIVSLARGDHRAPPRCGSPDGHRLVGPGLPCSGRRVRLAASARPTPWLHRHHRSHVADAGRGSRPQRHPGRDRRSPLPAAGTPTSSMTWT